MIDDSQSYAPVQASHLETFAQEAEIEGRRQLVEKEEAAKLKRERVEAGEFDRKGKRRAKGKLTADTGERANVISGETEPEEAPRPQADAASAAADEKMTQIASPLPAPSTAPATDRTPAPLTPQQLDSLTVKIKLSSDALPFFHPHQTGLAEFLATLTPKEKLKCEVFAHLWKTGHYMSQGIKFGGDFLVYKREDFSLDHLWLFVTNLIFLVLQRIPQSVTRPLWRWWSPQASPSPVWTSFPLGDCRQPCARLSSSARRTQRPSSSPSPPSNGAGTSDPGHPPVFLYISPDTSLEIRCGLFLSLLFFFSPPPSLCCCPWQ